MAVKHQHQKAESAPRFNWELMIAFKNIEYLKKLVKLNEEAKKPSDVRRN